MHKSTVALIVISFVAPGIGAELPRASQPIQVTLPDFGAELRRFDAPEREPVPWWPHVVNAGWGGGRGGPERNGGWLDRHWPLVDYIDRSGDYTTHEYLTHRGIWYEVYGNNEYQETIHFHEEGARKLFWDNGIARDMTGQRVLSADYNMSVPWWKEKIGWEAFITCNNAPRWWSVINYDWLTSPLLGHAMSQDNIGGPTSRIGAGGHGRYCDHCSAKFFHYLTSTGRLPEFRAKYRNIRDYVEENLADVLKQLPPNTRPRWDAKEADLYARLCAPPVMSEYQKFLYLSHLHNFLRYYEDAKVVARRQGRPYDVHGNQGGGFIGPNPYQIALADFVDTIWFETAGMTAYDNFQHHWHNAFGPQRYQMCYAMSRGRKPVMCMSRFDKLAPDLVEHEMAEQCAGGGVLFVNQAGFEGKPEAERLLTDYFRFRHAHRALFADPGRKRHSQIAVAYSIPTMMYHDYQYSGGAEPVTAFSGIGRVMEEGHLNYDMLIFNHPEIHADHVTLNELCQYRLLILPALECLSDGQVELISRYLSSGGTVGTIGACGVRNEDNLPRKSPALDKWRTAGRVFDLMPGKKFFAPRTTESPRTREIVQAAIGSIRKALGVKPVVDGEMPRLLWVKAWRHSPDFVSLHFLNYDADYKAGTIQPTAPVRVSVLLPDGTAGDEAAWLTPDGKSQPISLARVGDRAELTVPAVHVYGVLVIGPKGLDGPASDKLQREAIAARLAMARQARMAKETDRSAGVRLGPFVDNVVVKQEALTEKEPALAVSQTPLVAEQVHADKSYLKRVQEAGEMPGAVLQLDFGGKNPKSPWKAVAADIAYSEQVGFGWLPAHDDSQATPEETYYAQAASALRRGDNSPTEIRQNRLLFWPYKTPAPPPLTTNLACGSPRRFRVDLAPGDYTVRVVVTNPSWIFRNYQVSGMVAADGRAANGRVCLLDVPLDRGDLVAREFAVSVPDGRLELTFGGPTGWGVAAVMIRPGSTTKDPQVSGALREWKISPRYANPDWHPIRQIAAPPEKQLDRLPGPDWREIQAARGLPVVDLGSNRQAEVGDLVYASTVIRAEKPRRVALHFGATSAAQLWLNGRALGYVPNEKGLRRDEYVAPVDLAAGDNRLVVKLVRFWERRWQFYASVTE